MGRPKKALLKQNRIKKKSAQTLNSANEYLAGAGVDFEEAAGKWRAGDAVKSKRFFERAVSVYDEGLQKYPRSLDLAYNKARVQYEVATHPLLTGHLHLPVLNALEVALSSHRYALDLDAENPDSLFNTAQVLTSITEELLKVAQPSHDSAVRLLEEALGMQSKCLTIQELQHERDQQQEQEVAGSIHHPLAINILPPTAQDGGASQAPSEVSAEDEQWFSIVEPVTVDDLIDTALAQLGTLTVLCESLTSNQPHNLTAWIGGLWSDEILTKLLAYQQVGNERQGEIALAKANLASAVLEARFRGGELDPITYKDERDKAFQEPGLVLESSVAALLSNAQSLMTLSAALGDSTHFHVTSGLRWNALNGAISSLSSAAKLQNIDQEDLVKSQLLRGDVSLLQYQLGQSPVSYQVAQSNAVQLLKNAEIFYRNTAKLSRVSTEQSIATLRSAVAHGLATDNVEACVTTTAGGSTKEWTRAQLVDMVDEGLLPETSYPT